MATDITIVTESIADKVAQRIRSSFVELIPEDQWTAMVKKEIDRFTTTPDYYQASSEGNVSPLHKLIRQQLTAMFQEKFQAEICKPEYMPVWDGNKHQPGEAVKQIVKECMPELMNAAFGSMVQNVIQKMRSM